MALARGYAIVRHRLALVITYFVVVSSVSTKKDDSIIFR